MPASINKIIPAAIRKKAVLRFIYNGRERIVKPQTYGTSRAGAEVLRAYERGAGSITSMAKLFSVEKISDLKPAGKTFARALRQHSPQDSAMKEIFATLPLPE